MSTVFVVLGQSGSYEDYSRWLQGVFATKEEALGAVELGNSTQKRYRALNDAWKAKRLPWREHNLHRPEDLPRYWEEESYTIFEAPLGEWKSDIQEIEEP